MGESILSRVPAPTATLTPLQAQIDSAVSSNTRQITDPKFIVASLVGLGAAAGTLKASTAVVNSLPIRVSLTRVGYFIDEVFPVIVTPLVGSTAHELTYRSLEHLTGPENPHRWEFGGRGGVGTGLVRSNITFGPSLMMGTVTCFGTGAVISGAWSGPKLEVLTKGHYAFMGASGILVYLGSYWGISKGVNYIEDLLFGERSASDPSLKKDSSPASGK